MSKWDANKPVKMPRKTPTWEPAKIRFRNRSAEWLADCWHRDDGFFTRLTCVRSDFYQVGHEVTGFYYGDWFRIRDQLTLEVQLLESMYYQRLARLTEKGG